MAPKLNGTKEEFIEWTKTVAKDDAKQTAQFIECYHYLLNAFTEADADHDGEISTGEFDTMIERAAFYPRKHGLAPHEDQIFKNADERKAAREKFFKLIDSNGDGTISFNEFLSWSLAHMKEKIQVRVRIPRFSR